MAKILLVEDDASLAKTIREWLTAEQHVLDLSVDGEDALEKLRFYSYDAIVLDWNLPRLTGVAVCQEYRRLGGKTPIMMLTGKNKIEEKEEGFGVGADDYITKPFDFREFLVRLRALLRRPPSFVGERNVLVQGDLSLNTVTHEVTKAGNSVHLLPKEYSLLEFFLRHPDQVVSAGAILDRVWPSSSDMSPESVRIYVARLRKKIDTKGSPSLIETVHGFGYKFLNVNASPLQSRE